MHAGVDVDFLVALEIADHPFHEAACLRRDSWLDAGGRFGDEQCGGFPDFSLF